MTYGQEITHSKAAALAGDALLPALLALAVVTSTATKLRLPGVPLGIGELLLTGWLASSLMIRSVTTGFCWSGGFTVRWGGLFILVTSFALLAGAFLAEAAGVTGMYGTLHQAVAWVFVMVLLGWFLLESASARAVRRFLALFTVVGLLSTSALLVSAILSRLLLGSHWFWYFGFRMSGWSENPNQLAAMLAPLPFLAAHFRREAPDRWRRALWTAGMLGTVLAGIATQSDALFAAWLLCGAIVVADRWIRGMIGRARTVRSMVVNGIVMPCALAVVLVPAGAVLERLVESTVEVRANEGGQAGTRLSLWQNGMQAVAESPLVGWGPGSHSGLDGPFQGTESHNTFIDLAAQAGLPASIGLVAIVVLATMGPIRSRALLVGLAVVSIVTFAFFHNCLRHPVFWFVIFGALAASHGGPAARRDVVDLRPF